MDAAGSMSNTAFDKHVKLALKGGRVVMQPTTHLALGQRSSLTNIVKSWLKTEKCWVFLLTVVTVWLCIGWKFSISVPYDGTISARGTVYWVTVAFCPGLVFVVGAGGTFKARFYIAVCWLVVATALVVLFSLANSYAWGKAMGYH
jgi:hypothetical protein